MRIRTKVIGLAILPCVSLLIISARGWVSLNSSRLLAERALSSETETAGKIDAFNGSIVLLLNADRDAHQALIAEKHAIDSADPDAYARASADHATNLNQIEERATAAASAFDTRMASVYEQFRQDLSAWSSQSSSLVAAARPGVERKSLDAEHDKSIALFNAMRVHIDDLQNLEEGEVAGLRARAKTEGAQARTAFAGSMRSEVLLYLAVGGGSLLLTMLLSVWVCRSVFGRLGSLLTRMTQVAEGDGDLTVRINDQSHDEFGGLAQQFDTFVARVQEIMRAVAESSHSVASASTQIAASNEEMSAGLSMQSEQTTQVAEATQRMAETATQVATSSSEGGRVVSRTIAQIEEIAGAVQQSADKVGELGRKSEQIGQIIAVINDIADQTNLLALNAAIEAARAGEHGRGFAVVADEVRKLAERTTQATEQVGSSIREIQAETGAAVTNMQSGCEKVEAGVGSAREAGDALSSIVAASAQQSSATQEIAMSIEHLNSVASQSRQGAQQAAAAAAQLSCEAEKLQSLVSRFKL